MAITVGAKYVKFNDQVLDVKSIERKNNNKERRGKKGSCGNLCTIENCVQNLENR